MQWFIEMACSSKNRRLALGQWIRAATHVEFVHSGFWIIESRYISWFISTISHSSRGCNPDDARKS